MLGSERLDPRRHVVASWPIEPDRAAATGTIVSVACSQSGKLLRQSLALQAPRPEIFEECRRHAATLFGSG